MARRGFADSVTAAVANTNRLLLRLDSLATDARSLTLENRADLRQTVTNLNEASRQMAYFVDQLSRRPFRALTGIKPLPPRDSTVGTNGSGAKP
jgi:ABC-type transporter Mla subunit MlaD